MTVRERSSRWAPWLGAVLAGLAMAEVVTAITLSIVIGWSWRDALEAFVVTNSLMGVTFAGCGGILAWHRPGNPVGWLFVAAGLAHATTAVCAPAFQLLVDAGAPLPAQRLVLTMFAWSWPWSIGLCLPLALLLFPDGRPPSPRWRWVVVAVIVTAPLFAIEMGGSPMPMEPGYPIGYLTFSATTLCNRFGPLRRSAVSSRCAPASLLSRYVIAADLTSSVASSSGCYWRC